MFKLRLATVTHNFKCENILTRHNLNRKIYVSVSNLMLISPSDVLVSRSNKKAENDYISRAQRSTLNPLTAGAAYIRVFSFY